MYHDFRRNTSETCEICDVCGKRKERSYHNHSLGFDGKEIIIYKACDCIIKKLETTNSLEEVNHEYQL